MARKQWSKATLMREFIVQLAVSLFLSFIYGLILICH